MPVTEKAKWTLNQVQGDKTANPATFIENNDLCDTHGQGNGTVAGLRGSGMHTQCMDCLINRAQGIRFLYESRVSFAQ